MMTRLSIRQAREAQRSRDKYRKQEYRSSDSWRWKSFLGHKKSSVILREDRLPTQTPVTVGVTSNGKSERRQQQPEQQQKEQDMKTGRMREKHRKEKGRKTRGYLNKIETLEEAASNAEDYEKKRGR